MLVREGDELAVVNVFIRFGQIGKDSRRLLLSRSRMLEQQPLLVHRLLTRSPFGRPKVMSLVHIFPVVSNMATATAPNTIERGEDPNGPFTARRLRQKDNARTLNGWEP